MGGADRRAIAPRLAWAFPAVYLCLLLPTRLPVANHWTGPAGIATVVVLFVLPLLYTVPPGRSVWARHRGWLLVTQAALTYLPYALFGDRWFAGLSGLLAGLLLLTVAAPASWLLAGAVIAVDGALRVGVLGVPSAPGESLTTWAFIAPVNVSLALFGLVRLADLVTELHAARTELAALAVIRERLRAARRLREAIGDRLVAVSARAGAALAVVSRSPEQARGRLTEAAGIARQALDQAREVARGWREPGPPEPAPAGGTLAPRLARLVLLVVLCGFVVQLVMNLAATGAATTFVAGGAAIIVAVGALQLYHSVARREGGRPRAWALTLAAQALLTFAFAPLYELAVLGMAGFTAGSLLLLLPGRWGWGAAAATVAGTGMLGGALSVWGVADLVYVAASTAVTGLVVYGLSRLTDLAGQVEAALRDLARMAVVRERLRVAQDTHDLLGLGLSAIALKCDLVVRLLGRDDARARAELEGVLRIATQARTDVRSVTGEEQRLSLPAELTAAREVLASAGIDVEVRAGSAGPPLPAEVGVVLATVLREAVTNVLRHATARRCTIELTTGDGAVRLRVANDGVAGTRSAARPGPGGHGLANLTTRTETLGGSLTTRSEDSHFQLTAQIPVAGPTPVR